jgi:hypothetical protein
MLLCSITSVAAQVSVGVGFPGVSIGINLPVYPELMPVPGYPVYYAPQVNANHFHDGMYWVYQRDNWYASPGTTDPGLVAPEVVPPSCCAFRCAITGDLLRTFAGGVRMHHRAGVITGAIHGSSVIADGTRGIVALYPRRPRCLPISDNIRGIDIPAWSSSRCFKARTTVTSRETP